MVSMGRINKVWYYFTTLTFFVKFIKTAAGSALSQVVFLFCLQF